MTRFCSKYPVCGCEGVGTKCDSINLAENTQRDLEELDLTDATILAAEFEDVAIVNGKAYKYPFHPKNKIWKTDGQSKLHMVDMPGNPTHLPRKITLKGDAEVAAMSIEEKKRYLEYLKGERKNAMRGTNYTPPKKKRKRK